MGVCLGDLSLFFIVVRSIVVVNASQCGSLVGWSSGGEACEGAAERVPKWESSARMGVRVIWLFVYDVGVWSCRSLMMDVAIKSLPGRQGR